MIERKVALEQPELNRSGVIGVKIAKLLVEDGVEIECQWHRTAIEPGTDIQTQMGAVNSHLSSMGYPALAQADIDFLVQAREILVLRMESEA